MPRPGPRTKYRYTHDFKATAVRFRPEADGQRLNYAEPRSDFGLHDLLGASNSVNLYDDCVLWDFVVSRITFIL
jgi:hypothetical protein